MPTSALTVEEVRELLRRYKGESPDPPPCSVCAKPMFVSEVSSDGFKFGCRCGHEVRSSEPYLFDEEVVKLCNHFLAAQDAEDERPAPDLPQAVKDELFHQACLCADTEAGAQKQPCACRTFMLLEKIEQWGKSLASREPMTAGEFAGLVRADVRDRAGWCKQRIKEVASLEDVALLALALHRWEIVLGMLEDKARTHNIEIVEPKK